MTCKNCNHDVSLNYCPNCGQPTQLKRIDAHYVTHEIEHVLHFERGILYTVRELITSPGQNIKKYIAENRSRLVKPIIFIIITSLVYSVVIHFFDLDDGYVKYDDGGTKSTFGSITQWVRAHYGYSNIFMGLAIAFWTRLIFKKYGYNYFEILILLCFAMGMGMLIFAVFALFQGLTKINLMQAAGIIGVAYCTWAIGQFFDKKRLINYLNAFVAYLLGMVTFWLIAFLIGTVIDLLLKH
jgi:hypothetical protein